MSRRAYAVGWSDGQSALKVEVQARLARIQEEIDDIYRFLREGVTLAEAIATKKISTEYVDCLGDRLEKDP